MSTSRYSARQRSGGHLCSRDTGLMGNQPTLCLLPSISETNVFVTDKRGELYGAHAHLNMQFNTCLSTHNSAVLPENQWIACKLKHHRSERTSLERVHVQRSLNEPYRFCFSSRNIRSSCSASHHQHPYPKWSWDCVGGHSGVERLISHAGRPS